MSARILKFPLYLLFFFTPALSFASVYINEVFYSPQSRSWLEVYNDTEAAVDLSKYKVLDSGAAVNGHAVTAISGGTLLPHGYAVIAKDPTGFASPAYPLFKSALGAKTSGDTISLKDESGNLLDSFTFTSVLGAAGDGNSLQKTESGWVSAPPTAGLSNATAALLPTSPGDNPGATTTGPTESDPSLNITTAQSNVVTTVSTHYSYLPLSSFEAAQKLSVGAGRDRLVAAGSPLAFKAELDSGGGVTQYQWSFGDGTIGTGDRIDHIYKYPGDYVVVLNVDSNGHEATSRAKVKVVDPQLAISYAGGDRIEVSNDSPYEINLYGWKLAANGKSFAFPQDTIIVPRQKISFDSSITGLSPSGPESVLLESGLGQSQSVAQIKQKLLALQSELSSLAVVQTKSQEKPEVKTEEASSPQVAAPILVLDSKTATTSPSVKKSWFTTLKHFFGLK